MKKKILSYFILVLILAVLVPYGTAYADVSLSVGSINADGVALRKNAGTNGKLIARLSEGTVVKILESNVNAEWYRVECAGKTGYVNRLYVNIESSLPSYQSEYTGTVVNCEKDVNIREEARQNAPLLGVAEKGTVLHVTVPNVKDGWHQIDYQGKTGYIASQYLQLTAKVDNASLTGLSVKGGTLSPAFSPKEYGYILTAEQEQVEISAMANDGVKVSIGNTGVASGKYTIHSGNSKTIRISVGGKVRYTIYLVRDVLTVGTWNIKRGNDNLIMQGWLIGAEHPDIIGIQEVYLHDKKQINNLLSLRTKEAQHMSFAATIDYSGGGQYGIGQISKFEPLSNEKIELETGDKEDRFIQKVEYEISGKRISVYNTHFSYESAAIRKKQFTKVLSLLDADSNPYRILTGDFNAKEAEFSMFKKNYKIVNTSATKFYNYSYQRIDVNQIDNIIVSKNITILNARAIPTEYSDHYPLFAFLSLK